MHTYRALVFAPGFGEKRSNTIFWLEFDFQILGECDRVGVEKNAHKGQLRIKGVSIN